MIKAASFQHLPQFHGNHRQGEGDNTNFKHLLIFINLTSPEATLSTPLSPLRVEPKATQGESATSPWEGEGELVRKRGFLPHKNFVFMGGPYLPLF